MNRQLSRRHGGRSMRSAMTGPLLKNPYGRMTIFKNWAAPVIQFLGARFPKELERLNIGFSTAPVTGPFIGGASEIDANNARFYTIYREQREIILHRMPIQRFRGLHVNDETHRRLFVEHIIYRAVCDYLEVEPWELLPGYFEHY